MISQPSALSWAGDHVDMTTHISNLRSQITALQQRDNEHAIEIQRRDAERGREVELGKAMKEREAELISEIQVLYRQREKERGEREREREREKNVVRDTQREWEKEKEERARKLPLLLDPVMLKKTR
jgi:hypothetical protein